MNAMPFGSVLAFLGSIALALAIVLAAIIVLFFFLPLWLAIVSAIAIGAGGILIMGKIFG